MGGITGPEEVLIKPACVNSPNLTVASLHESGSVPFLSPLMFDLLRGPQAATYELRTVAVPT